MILPPLTGYRKTSVLLFLLIRVVLTCSIITLLSTYCAEAFPHSSASHSFLSGSCDAVTQRLSNQRCRNQKEKENGWRRRENKCPCFSLLSLFPPSHPPPSSFFFFPLFFSFLFFFFYFIHLISPSESVEHNEGLGRIIRSCWFWAGGKGEKKPEKRKREDNLTFTPTDLNSFGCIYGL